MLPLALQANTLALTEEPQWQYHYISSTDVAITGTVNDVIGELNIPSTIVSNGQTYNVKAIQQRIHAGVVGGGAFENYKNITSVKIPSSVELIDDNSFRGCTNLTKIELSEGLKRIGYMAFADCEKVRGDLVLPSTLLSITGWAFHKCPFDGTLFVRAQQPQNDETFFFTARNEHGMDAHPVFTNSNFNKIVLSGEYPVALAAHKNERVYYRDWKILINNVSGLRDNKRAMILEIDPEVKRIADYGVNGINVSRSDFSTLLSHVEEIGLKAFGNSNIGGPLIIPTSVKKIKDWAFQDNNIKNLIFTAPSSISVIENSAFRDCKLEGEVIIPNSIDSLGYGVFSDNNLTKIRVEEGHLKTIPASFVNNNPLLTQVVLSNSIQVLGGGSFANCPSITNISLPQNLIKIGDSAFENCTSLVNVLLPEKLSIIEANAFENCTSLFKVQLPETLQKIATYAFKNCINLEQITPLPNRIEEISDGVFEGCVKLKGDASDFLPNSLKRIGGKAFNGMRGITGEAVFPDNEIQTSGINPFMGTSVYGIRMNKCLNLFNSIDNYSSSDNAWDANPNLFYIDTHQCTVRLGSGKQANNSVFKFTRKWTDRTQYPEFNNLSVNTMVYLPSNETFNVGSLPNKNFDDRFNDEGAENFVMDGKCAHFFVKDGLPYRIPYAFTALEAKYDRVFSPTGGKNVSTLYLPYPTDLPTGMKAYELSVKGYDANGVKAFIFEPVSTPLKANTPYLVQVTDGATHTLPTMYNVEVPASPCFDTDSKYIAPSYKRSYLNATGTTDWNFYGTTERINNDEAYTEKALYLKQSQWWSVGQNVENDFIAPFRCFISSPSGAALAKSFVMVLDGDDKTTTKINELENTTNNDIKSGRYPFYTTDGKLVGYDYNLLSRGQLYIVNGKKFYKL